MGRKMAVSTNQEETHNGTTTIVTSQVVEDANSAVILHLVSLPLRDYSKTETRHRGGVPGENSNESEVSFE